MRLALFLWLALLAAPGYSDEYIAINAEGWVEAVPDTLSLSIGIRETGRDVESLQSGVDRTTRQVVSAAREAGVAEDDIDSSRLSVQPEYRWGDGKQIYVGQAVRREITITLRDLEAYGGLVQAISDYAVEGMSAPRLSHSQIDELRLAALDNALAQGFVKARRIAQGIGADLGKVIRVEEQGAVRAPPMEHMMAAESARGAPTVQFGKQRISAAVSMRFAIN